MIDERTHIVQPSEGAKEKRTLETIALTGASAIRRIISERDDLRVRVKTQQGDLVHLNAANVELRRCVMSIRQHYLELASKVLAQLEEFDQSTRDLVQERQGRSFNGRLEDDNLVSLANRLKPAGARQTGIADFDD
jgi:hypothetical protein